MAVMCSNAAGQRGASAWRCPNRPIGLTGQFPSSNAFEAISWSNGVLLPAAKATAGNAPVAARFSRDQRVRRRAEFQKVFDNGTRLHGRYLTILMRPNGGRLPRLGIVASRKFGGAVERNRAKRLIREMFRQHVAGSPGHGVDVVVIPRRELLGVPFPIITQDFQSVWRRGADRVAAPDARMKHGS